MDTEILGLDPEHVASYTRRGCCQLAAGDLDAAEADFRRALDLDPRNRISINRLKELKDLRARRGGLRRNALRASGRGHHNVYVVELRWSVLTEERFAAANPEHDPAKPCVYVGLTGLDPEERYLNHLTGIKASRFVEEYGARLMPELYEHLNPMPYEVALRTEGELARELRREGYAVWSN